MEIKSIFDAFSLSKSEKSIGVNLCQIYIKTFKKLFLKELHKFGVCFAFAVCSQKDNCLKIGELL